jgi:hypothetical protein
VHTKCRSVVEAAETGAVPGLRPLVVCHQTRFLAAGRANLLHKYSTIHHLLSERDNPNKITPVHLFAFLFSYGRRLNRRRTGRPTRYHRKWKWERLVRGVDVVNRCVQDGKKLNENGERKASFSFDSNCFDTFSVDFILKDMLRNG